MKFQIVLCFKVTYHTSPITSPAYIFLFSTHFYLPLGFFYHGHPSCGHNVKISVCLCICVSFLSPRFDLWMVERGHPCGFFEGESMLSFLERHSRGSSENDSMLLFSEDQGECPMTFFWWSVPLQYYHIQPWFMSLCTIFLTIFCQFFNVFQQIFFYLPQNSYMCSKGHISNLCVKIEKITRKIY